MSVFNRSKSLTCCILITALLLMFLVVIIVHAEIERRIEKGQIGEHIWGKKAQQSAEFVQIVLHRRACENCEGGK